MVLLAPDATPAVVQRAVPEYGYSRYVITDTAGEPTAYNHMKDVMDLAGAELEAPIPAKRHRQLGAVSRDAELEDAMTQMRRRGTHVAKTLDADCNTIGLLYLEDVLEVLVGEINAAAAA